jgi:hypothetical protein
MLFANVGVEVCRCRKLGGAEKADRGRKRGRCAMGRSDVGFEGGAIPKEESALAAFEDWHSGVLAVRVGTDLSFRAGESTNTALDVGDELFKGQVCGGERRDLSRRACVLGVRRTSLGLCMYILVVVTVAIRRIGERAPT